MTKFNHLTRRSVAIAACAAILAACGGHDASQSGEITVTDGVIYQPFPGKTTSASFFTINNPGSDDRLIAVKSALSDTVEIHTHIHSDQGMKMMRVDAIDVDKGKTTLKSGGDHIMLFNVDSDAFPETSDLTLVFETAGEITVNLPVRAPGDDG